MNFAKLLNKNKTVEPRTYDAVYGAMVEKELEANGYTTSKIQAILNNYLSEPTNLKYKDEFWELQDCRNLCKSKVKAKLNI